MINKLQKHFVLILIIGAIFSMLICLIVGSMQSVWFDEAYSIITAKQSVSELIRLTALDTHPPFYYLLLKLWGSIINWSEIALRSLSIVSMGGAIIFAGLLVKKIFDKRTAIITLPFIIFAPFLLRYGFEIRMYSLASLICIAATYTLVCAIETKNINKSYKFYVIYAILVSLGVYTLYYTVLLWTAHLLWLIWRSRQNNENILKSNWLKSYIFSVILFLPWLILFIKQITNGALAPISQSMTIDNLIGIISFSFLYQPTWQLNALQSFIILYVIAMIIYLSINCFKQLKDKKTKQYFVLLIMYFVVPISILTIVGLVKPMYVERYLAHVMIGGNIIIGVLVSMIPVSSKRFIKILGMLLAVVMMIGIVQLIQVGNFNFQRMQNIKVKQATNNIECNNQNIVYVASPYEAIELSYYLSSCKIYFYSDKAKLGGGYAILSNNKLRVFNPSIELKDMNKIYFYHYGDTKLQMPDNMINTRQQKFDSLVVDEYKAL